MILSCVVDGTDVSSREVIVLLSPVQAGIRWLQLQTGERQIPAFTNSEDLVVQMLRPEQPPVKLRGKIEVSLREASRALLRAIPPFGTKFKPEDQRVPQGKLNAGLGCVFRLGKLPIQRKMMAVLSGAVALSLWLFGGRGIVRR